MRFDRQDARSSARRSTASTGREASDTGAAETRRAATTRIPFDHRALRQALLDPLGPGGDRRYRCAVFDVRTDRPVGGDVRAAPVDAVLVMDGVFLLRPELRDAWEFALFVRVSPEETLRRALVRDLGLFGSAEEVERRYRTRYLPGQQLYLDEARPLEHADAVVLNDEPGKACLIA